MKKKKIMIITTIVSFLLVTALSMQFSSEKAVNDESQLVQKRTEVNPNGTTSIVRSAVLPGSPAMLNEYEENKEPILEQTYTEINPNGTPSIVRSAALPGSSTTQNESKENGEFVLEQTYTEVNPSVYSVMP